MEIREDCLVSSDERLEKENPMSPKGAQAIKMVPEDEDL